MVNVLKFDDFFQVFNVTRGRVIRNKSARILGLLWGNFGLKTFKCPIDSFEELLLSKLKRRPNTDTSA